MRALYCALLCFVVFHANAIAKTNPDFEHFLHRARVEYGSAHYGASEKLFLSALKTLQRNDDAERAEVLAELGDVYLNQDNLSKAETVYSDAFAIFRRLGDTTRMIVALRNLGAIYSLEGRDDVAMTALRQALKVAKASSENPAVTAQILNSMGIVYFRQNRIGKAKELFEQAFQIVSATPTPFDRGELLINLGTVYQAKRDFDRAEDLFKQALKIAESSAGAAHPDMTFALSALAKLYADEAKYDAAEQQYLRTLAILEQNNSDLDTRIARVLHAMSLMYTKAGRSSEAGAALARAAAVARRNVEAHSDMARILEDYAAALRKQGKMTEAEDARSVANRARAAAALVVRAHNRYEGVR